MTHVAIIGMGLIGTSLGMALRSATDTPLGEVTVTGFDREARNVSEARARLAIDREARGIGEALRDAQIVVLAVPVQAVHEVLQAIGPLLAAGTIVTDVCSTKAQVVQWARESLPSSVDFVGGHPMAGREISGPAGASPDLFRDAIYCLTPDVTVREEALAAVEAMARQVGAKPYFIDPVEHDSYVAGISHLPFLLSTALVQVTASSPGWTEMSPLAASGYRDMSRLAAGDTAMHRDICMTNRESIARWLDETARELIVMRDQVAAGDEAALTALFDRARATREAWLVSRPNTRPGEEEVERQHAALYEQPTFLGRFGLGGPRRKR